MRADFPYKKIASLRGFLRKSSLWEGPDHFLLLTGTRFVEEYRRFYYNDVQAVLQQRSRRSGSIGVLAVLLLTGTITLSIAAANGAVLANLAGWALLLAAVVRVVIALRFSCRCHVFTAVSSADLTPICRTWQARKVVPRMLARITAAQGELRSELPVSDEAPLFGTPSDGATGASTPASSVTGWPLAGFSLLLLNAAWSFFVLNSHLPRRLMWLSLAATVIFATAQGTCFVVALIKSRRRPECAMIRNLLIGCLAFLGVKIYIDNLYLNFARGAVTRAFIYSPFWFRMGLFFGSAEIVLGIAGFAILLLNWDTYKERQVSPV